MIANCVVCGKEFRVLGLAKTCSPKCSAERIKARQQSRQQTLEYKAWKRAYHQSPEYKAKRKVYTKAPRYKAWRRSYRKSAQAKIACGLRNRILKALKGEIKWRFEWTSCSKEFFVRHLERNWRPGMSWENHGIDWEIDHRNPCASFDLTDPEQRRKCFHWLNQRPLWRHINRSKGTKPYEYPSA